MVLLRQFLLVRSLAHGLASEEGACQSTPLSCLSPEKHWERRELFNMQPDLWILCTSFLETWESCCTLHWDQMQPWPGTSATTLSGHINKSLVAWAQFHLLSGSLSRASQDFPHQETALQSGTPSPLSLSFLALFILWLLCHWNKMFLLTAVLSKAQFLQDHYSSSRLVLRLPVDLRWALALGAHRHLEEDRKQKGHTAFQAPRWHPQILGLFISAPGSIPWPWAAPVCSGMSRRLKIS